MASPADSARAGMAALLARGVSRHLAQHGFLAIPEVPLPNGRRADLLAVGASGEIWIVEIKSSIEDFRLDRKWREYRGFCDRLFFASHAGVPEEIFPDDMGLILADGFDAEIRRDCAVTALKPATRKALLVQVAQLGARRLLLVNDPEFRSLGRDGQD